MPDSNLSIDHSTHERKARPIVPDWHPGYLSVDARKNRALPGPVVKNKLFLNSKIQTQSRLPTKKAHNQTFGPNYHTAINPMKT